MGDLISRSALLEAFEKEEKKYEDCMILPSAFSMISIAREQPTVEAEPVVHGEWLDVCKLETQYGTMEACLCSNCKCEIVIDTFGDYCHNCGAKMDGGVSDD